MDKNATATSLCRLAQRLDKQGLKEEADLCDKVLKSFAQENIEITEELAKLYLFGDSKNSDTESDWLNKLKNKSEEAVKEEMKEVIRKITRDILNNSTSKDVDASKHEYDQYIAISEEPGITKAVEICFSYLQEKIANPEKENGEALLHAARDGNSKKVKDLLDAGAYIDYLDGIGSSSLHVAASYGHAEIVTLLLEVGADINLESDIGTAMHAALENNSMDIAETMLRFRPNLTLKDDADKTVYEMITEKGLKIGFVPLDK